MMYSHKEKEWQEEMGGRKAVRAFKNRLFFKVRNGVHSIILRMLAYKLRKFKPFLL